jgi:DHA1 family multidrug resistance protein-like MFS transporter
LQAWQRNLYVMWFAEFMAIAGFSFVMPFLPYYVQDLGITDLTKVELWSGVLYAAHAIPMAIFAPIWGVLADRYGRKPMVLRSMLGGAVTLGAMGFAQTIEQLLVLRLIQGMLTGTVAAATTLVAGSTPRQRSGYALGLLQMAIFGGSSVGPLIGGLVCFSWPGSLSGAL